MTVSSQVKLHACKVQFFCTTTDHNKCTTSDFTGSNLDTIQNQPSYTQPSWLFAVTYKTCDLYSYHNILQIQLM